MGVVTPSGEALEWRGGHETIRIEPWGRNSLRVRGTVWQHIRDDQPGALLPPAPSRAELETAGARLPVGEGQGRLLLPRRAGMVAGRMRARDGARAARQRALPPRARPRGRQHLPGAARPGVP